MGIHGRSGLLCRVIVKSYWKELNSTLLDRSRKGQGREQAKKLTSQTKSKPEAGKAIRDYLAKSIRIAGPSFAELP